MSIKIKREDDRRTEYDARRRRRATILGNGQTIGNVPSAYPSTEYFVAFGCLVAPKDAREAW